MLTQKYIYMPMMHIIAYHVEVYSMTKTMTPDPGKYDHGKLNDDPDSMTTLNYDMLSLDLAK